MGRSAKKSQKIEKKTSSAEEVDRDYDKIQRINDNKQ